MASASPAFMARTQSLLAWSIAGRAEAFKTSHCETDRATAARTGITAETRQGLQRHPSGPDAAGEAWQGSPKSVLGPWPPPWQDAPRSAGRDRDWGDQDEDGGDRRPW